MRHRRLTSCVSRSSRLAQVANEILSFLVRKHGFAPPLFTHEQAERIVRIWAIDHTHTGTALRANTSAKDLVHLFTLLVLCTRPEGAPPLTKRDSTASALTDRESTYRPNEVAQPAAVSQQAAISQPAASSLPAQGSAAALPAIPERSSAAKDDDWDLGVKDSLRLRIIHHNDGSIAPSAAARSAIWSASGGGGGCGGSEVNPEPHPGRHASPTQLS